MPVRFWLVIWVFCFFVANWLYNLDPHAGKKRYTRTSNGLYGAGYWCTNGILTTFNQVSVIDTDGNAIVCYGEFWK